MQIAFYKARGNFYDLLVRIATLSKYSHCELVIDGTCFSSSPRDNGVRKKKIDLNSADWDLIDLPEYLDKQQAINWFNQHIGQKYDWSGAIRSASLFGKNKQNRWFCSEAIAAALLLEQASKFTPALLYKYFKERSKDGY